MDLKPEFLKALGEVIREEVTGNRPVDLPGIGRFEKVHQKQYQQKTDSGQVVMMPPADRLQFTPAPENRDGE